MSILRSILGVFAGTIVGMILLFAIQSLGSWIHPAPPDLDFYGDRERVAEFIAQAPLSAKLLILSGYIIGTFAGAWLAAWIARRRPILHGMIVGVLFLLAGIANLLMIPHPLWFAMVNIILFLPAAYLGARCAPSKPPPAAT